MTASDTDTLVLPAPIKSDGEYTYVRLENLWVFGSSGHVSFA
jgi:hypothetical protein